jgi:hypothetical protein
VAWWEGTWRKVTGFNVLHHWPKGHHKWDYPLAVEAARKAAVDFYEEKLASGQIKVSEYIPAQISTNK